MAILPHSIIHGLFDLHDGNRWLLILLDPPHELPKWKKGLRFPFSEGTCDMVVLPNLSLRIFGVRVIVHLVLITSILMEVHSQPRVLISFILGILYLVKKDLLVLISWLNEEGICNTLTHQDHRISEALTNPAA